MKTRLIVPAILSAVVLSTPVLAAGSYDTPMSAGHHMQQAGMMTPLERCMSLEKQFDAAITAHEKAPMAHQAKIMRADGGSLCARGEHDQGITKLEGALKDLGLTPKN